MAMATSRCCDNLEDLPLQETIATRGSKLKMKLVDAATRLAELCYAMEHLVEPILDAVGDDNPLLNIDVAYAKLLELRPKTKSGLTVWRSVRHHKRKANKMNTYFAASSMAKRQKIDRKVQNENILRTAASKKTEAIHAQRRDNR